MVRAGLRLELEPPLAGEQHLDPDVGVRGPDQVAAVLLLDASSIPAPMRAGSPSVRTMTAIADEYC